MLPAIRQSNIGSTLATPAIIDGYQLLCVKVPCISVAVLLLEWLVFDCVSGGGRVRYGPTLFHPDTHVKRKRVRESARAKTGESDSKREPG